MEEFIKVPLLRNDSVFYTYDIPKYKIKRLNGRLSDVLKKNIVGVVCEGTAHYFGYVEYDMMDIVKHDGIISNTELTNIRYLGNLTHTFPMLTYNNKLRFWCMESEKIGDDEIYDLKSFLLKNNLLDKFTNNILKHGIVENFTNEILDNAKFFEDCKFPEDILHKFYQNVYMDYAPLLTNLVNYAFEYRNTEEGFDFWKNIENEWIND
jgi:hypothetical protein